MLFGILFTITAIELYVLKRVNKAHQSAAINPLTGSSLINPAPGNLAAGVIDIQRTCEEAWPNNQTKFQECVDNAASQLPGGSKTGQEGVLEQARQ